MIDKFSAVAKILSPAKQLFVLVSVISVGFFAYELLLSNSSTESGLIGPLVFFIWSYSAWAYINAFVGVPELSDDLGFFKRIITRFSRGIYWLVSIVFALSTIGVVFITYKLIKAWLL
jgi:hypothetical protein